MNYRIKPSKKFETALLALLKTHYRKNKRGAEACKLCIRDLLSLLLRGDIQSANSREEPWPSNTRMKFPQGSLWKMRFNLPELRGAASKARLIYLLYPRDDENTDIHLLMLYTHAEYAKRPSDAVLKAALDTLELR